MMSLLIPTLHRFRSTNHACSTISKSHKMLRPEDVTSHSGASSLTGLMTAPIYNGFETRQGVAGGLGPMDRCAPTTRQPRGHRASMESMCHQPFSGPSLRRFRDSRHPRPRAAAPSSRAFLDSRHKWTATAVSTDRTAPTSRETSMGTDLLIQDFRVGLRVLLREKGFCAMAVTVLALGICGVATTFSVVNGVMLRGFSFPNSARLVSVQFIDPTSNNFFGFNSQMSAMDFEEMRPEQKSFEMMAGYLNGSTVNATIDGHPKRF